MFKKFISTLLIFSLVFVTSCSPLNLSGERWAQYKDARYRGNKDYILNLNYSGKSTPIFLNYVGYNKIKYKKFEGTYPSYSNIDRIDFYAGFIWLRIKKSERSFWYYIPLGVMAMSERGFLLTYKDELYIRPTPEGDLIPIILVGGFAGATGGQALILYTLLLFREEYMHFYDDVINTEEMKMLKNFYSTFPMSFLMSIPIVNLIFYYTNPIEIKAKFSKFLYFPDLPNLDSNVAYNQYEKIVKEIAQTQIHLEKSNESVKSRIRKLKGTIIRIDPEQKYWNPWDYKGILSGD